MNRILIKFSNTLKSVYYLIIWGLKTIRNRGYKNYIIKEDHIENVYILGNGPSFNLALRTIKKSNNIKTCVVNFAILSPLFKEIKPNYYVIADPAFFIKPTIDNRFKQVIKELNKINWNMTIYIPYVYYNIIKLELSNSPYLNIIPFHTNAFHENMKFIKLKYFIYKLGLACPRVQNVIIASIYCMINTGYKNIQLYGVEHSWTLQIQVNKENQVCLKDIHFYDKEKVTMTPWLKNNNEPFKMHEILRTLSYMFIGYHDLQNYAKYLGNVNIINKTKDSFIDAFTKEYDY